jgi:hypothetical protein
MRKGWKIFFTIVTVAVIVAHFIGYSNNTFGIDQLIPCILGYLAIWVILMSMEPNQDDGEWYSTQDDKNFKAVMEKELDEKLKEIKETKKQEEYESA